MTNAQAIAEFLGHVEEKHKHIDILINDASYPFDLIMWDKGFTEVAKEGLERVIAVDLKATFRFLQATISFIIKMAR